MQFLKKTIGFLAVIGVVPGALALTARPSMVATASSRMPTMASLIGATSAASTASALLDSAECIDAYMGCMKGVDTCGTSFEECTNKVLFHAKMPLCLSTLSQCNTNGINSLFGTSAISSLSTVATKNSYGEVTDYTYPTDGSVLGQMITAAAISNRYDTPTCVRRYTACLKKDNVCGEDFELCTTTSEFKKQRVYCDSTLARCQGDGIKELFGTTTVSATPSDSSRIGEMITEGASLASVNAVSTCYKVADQCILNACGVNPYLCTENSLLSIASAAADASGDENSVARGRLRRIMDKGTLDTVAKSDVSSYIKDTCYETIGKNKYCYMTSHNGSTPSASQLLDEDIQDETFADIYASRMNTAMKSKITELVSKFDTDAKSRCSDTIKSCAMRVCGGGVGAVCYSSVFSTTGHSINGTSTYNEIKTGCSAIVNTDAYCNYAAQNLSTVGGYEYAYMNADAFDKLFPALSTGNDPIGVVAALNATLATSYSDAAIDQMRKNCQAVATSCVKSMCGNDYVNCYRNRTDIYSSLTNSDNTKFDKSMNKVGGVLDYTIVLGLCLDTVKNASVCEEHLSIEAAKLDVGLLDSDDYAWGGAESVRQGWMDAGGATKLTAQQGIQATDENGNKLCTTKNGIEQKACNTVGDDGTVYDQPVFMTVRSYKQTQVANSLFKDLIYDLEKEAQAKYNAKLTKQQNMCLSSNDGGIMGTRDLGSTYLWAKLKGSKVPADYAMQGLKDGQFVASNELYGSFCRIRVTLQSSDKIVQDILSGKSVKDSQGKSHSGLDASVTTRYFAAGDAFTCGSWLTSADLKKITDVVVANQTAGKAETQRQLEIWLPIVAGVASGVGGAYLGDAIYNGDAFGKLSGLSSRSRKNSLTELQMAQACEGYVSDAKSAAKESFALEKPEQGRNLVKGYLNGAIRYAETLGVDKATIQAASNAADELTENENDKGKFTSITIEGLNRTADTLAVACELAVKNGNKKSSVLSAEEKEKRDKTIGVTTLATTLAGTALTWGITRSISDATMSKAEREAYDAWMSQVGQYIHCYIGSEEVGGFGDTISTSME